MYQVLRGFIFWAMIAYALPSDAYRPKVGLALGGGGAKGAATIGVLKVMEKVGIKVDYIAGTSIGAVIGGLYASGYSINELETMFISQEWQDILEGHRIDAKLKSLLTNQGFRSFSDTRIPFRCVAAEEKSLNEVVLSTGDLYKAIRASMSIPKFYEPVKWGELSLVDGGVINNLPVDVAIKMGADIVIAIDLEQKSGFSLGISTKELFGVGGLVNWLFARPDIKRRQENIKEADVHINPRLPGFTPMSFGHDNCVLMIELGIREAKNHLEELLEIKNRQR